MTQYTQQDMLNPLFQSIPGAQLMMPFLAGPIKKMTGIDITQLNRQIVQSNLSPAGTASYLRQLDMSLIGRSAYSSVFNQRAADLAGTFGRLTGQDPAVLQNNIGFRAAMQLSQAGLGETGAYMGLAARNLITNSRMGSLSTRLAYAGAKDVLSDLYKGYDSGSFGGLSRLGVAALAANITSKTGLEQLGGSSVKGFKDAGLNLRKRIKELGEALRPLRDVFGEDIPKITKMVQSMSGQSIQQMSGTRLKTISDRIASGLLTGSFSMADLSLSASSIGGILNGMGASNNVKINRSNIALMLMGMSKGGKLPSYMTEEDAQQHARLNAIRIANSKHTNNYNKAFAIFADKGDFLKDGKFDMDAARKAFQEKYLREVRRTGDASQALLNITGSTSLYDLNRGLASDHYKEIAATGDAGRASMKAQASRIAGDLGATLSNMQGIDGTPAQKQKIISAVLADTMAGRTDALNYLNKFSALDRKIAKQVMNTLKYDDRINSKYRTLELAGNLDKQYKKEENIRKYNDAVNTFMKDEGSRKSFLDILDQAVGNDGSIDMDSALGKKYSKKLAAFSTTLLADFKAIADSAARTGAKKPEERLKILSKSTGLAKDSYYTKQLSILKDKNATELQKNDAAKVMRVLLSGASGLAVNRYLGDKPVAEDVNRLYDLAGKSGDEKTKYALQNLLDRRSTAKRIQAMEGLSDLQKKQLTGLINASSDEGKAFGEQFKKKLLSSDAFKGLANKELRDKIMAQANLAVKGNTETSVNGLGSIVSDIFTLLKLHLGGKPGESDTKPGNNEGNDEGGAKPNKKQAPDNQAITSLIKSVQEAVGAIKTNQLAIASLLKQRREGKGMT